MLNLDCFLSQESKPTYRFPKFCESSSATLYQRDNIANAVGLNYTAYCRRGSVKTQRHTRVSCFIPSNAHCQNSCIFAGVTDFCSNALLDIWKQVTDYACGNLTIYRVKWFMGRFGLGHFGSWAVLVVSCLWMITGLGLYNEMHSYRAGHSASTELLVQ